ncbi:MAG: hypothetical protein IJ313_01160 [Clostridia bacterium]|nr:hypothetical protein [Clostridia bacterium]
MYHAWHAAVNPGKMPIRAAFLWQNAAQCRKMRFALGKYSKKSLVNKVFVLQAGIDVV